MNIAPSMNDKLERVRRAVCCHASPATRVTYQRLERLGVTKPAGIHKKTALRYAISKKAFSHHLKAINLALKEAGLPQRLVLTKNGRLRLEGVEPPPLKELNAVIGEGASLREVRGLCDSVLRHKTVLIHGPKKSGKSYLLRGLARYCNGLYLDGRRCTKYKTPTLNELLDCLRESYWPFDRDLLDANDLLRLIGNARFVVLDHVDVRLAFEGIEGPTNMIRLVRALGPKRLIVGARSFGALPKYLEDLEGIFDHQLPLKAPAIEAPFDPYRWWVRWGDNYELEVEWRERFLAQLPSKIAPGKLVHQARDFIQANWAMAELLTPGQIAGLAWDLALSLPLQPEKGGRKIHIINTASANHPPAQKQAASA